MASVEITTENFDEITSKDGLVLLDFWAEWCGPCRKFGPVFEAASEKHEDVVFGKIDTDAQNALGAKMEVSSIPTIVGFKNGELVFRQAGALAPAALEEVIDAMRKLDA